MFHDLQVNVVPKLNTFLFVSIHIVKLQHSTATSKWYPSLFVTLHSNTQAMFAATTMASPTCSDADGGTITYSISSGDDVANKFAFPNVNTAVLMTTATALDYETKTSYTLIVHMVDAGSTHTGTVTVYVQVGVVGCLKHQISVGVRAYWPLSLPCQTVSPPHCESTSWSWTLSHIGLLYVVMDRHLSQSATHFDVVPCLLTPSIP